MKKTRLARPTHAELLRHQAVPHRPKKVGEKGVPRAVGLHRRRVSQRGGHRSSHSGRDIWPGQHEQRSPFPKHRSLSSIHQGDQRREFNLEPADGGQDKNYRLPKEVQMEELRDRTANSIFYVSLDVHLMPSQPYGLEAIMRYQQRVRQDWTTCLSSGTLSLTITKSQIFSDIVPKKAGPSNVLNVRAIVEGETLSIFFLKVRRGS